MCAQSKSLQASNILWWFILFIIQQFDLLLSQWFAKEELRRIASHYCCAVKVDAHTYSHKYSVDKRAHHQYKQNTKMAYCFWSKYFLLQFVTALMHTKQSLSLRELFYFWYAHYIFVFFLLLLPSFDYSPSLVNRSHVNFSVAASVAAPAAKQKQKRMKFSVCLMSSAIIVLMYMFAWAVALTKAFSGERKKKRRKSNVKEMNCFWIRLYVFGLSSYVLNWINGWAWYSYAYAYAFRWSFENDELRYEFYCAQLLRCETMMRFCPK